MGLWDWIWTSVIFIVIGAVIVCTIELKSLSRKVEKSVREAVLRSLFEDAQGLYSHYVAEITGLRKRLSQDSHKELELYLREVYTERKRWADHMNEVMRDQAEELTRVKRDQAERLSNDMAEVHHALAEAIQERKRTVTHLEEISSIFEDQKGQIERLSAELRTSNAQQRQLEEALAMVVSRRESEETRRSDRVWFSAFAPRTVPPRSKFLFDIWAHTLEQSGVVNAIAQELTRPQRVGVKAGIAIDRGAIIAIEISIPTFNAKEVDHMVWDGEPVNVSFHVSVPVTAHQGSHSGSAAISVEGLQIAKLSFSLTVDKFTDRLLIFDRPGELPIGIRHFNSAFASYATSERPQVLARLQGIKKVAPYMEIFLDVVSLRSGDNWQEALAREVPTKDVFYLFWSQAAAASEWVAREWSLALTKRGLDYIDPVPLQDPRHAPPPNELSDLHFNDAYLAYIELERQLCRAGERGQNPATGQRD